MTNTQKLIIAGGLAGIALVGALLFVPSAPATDPPTGFVRVHGDAGAQEADASTSPSSIGHCLIFADGLGGFNCDMAVPVGTFTVVLVKNGKSYVSPNSTLTVQAGSHNDVTFTTVQ